MEPTPGMGAIAAGSKAATAGPIDAGPTATMEKYPPNPAARRWPGQWAAANQSGTAHTPPIVILQLLSKRQFPMGVATPVVSSSTDAPSDGSAPETVL